MKKTIVFLVIMTMLCSTAYAIVPESAAALQSRSIVIKTTPMTGSAITGDKIQWDGNQNGAMLGSGGDPRGQRGIIIHNTPAETRGAIIHTKPSYPGRDGTQTVKKTGIINPLFKPTSGTEQKGLTIRNGRPSSTSIENTQDSASIIDPLFKPTSTARKYVRTPTGKWIEDVTTEAVINVPKLTQTSMNSNPYYLGGAKSAMTAGQAYSAGQRPITQASNPYALGGAGVPTTAGQAKDIEAMLKERQQRAIQALGRVY